MLKFKKSKLEQIKTFIRNLEEDGVAIEKSDKEKIIKLIKPTIGIDVMLNENNSILVGKSKIGGKPDVPQNFVWPRANNKPMLFCAQYNLSELTKFDKEDVLPNQGFFYIFLSLDEEYEEFNGLDQDYKFIYSASENVQRAEFPNDLEEDRQFDYSPIEYFEFFTIPDLGNYKLSELDKKYHDFNYYVYNPISEYISEVCDTHPDNYHQLLGEDRAMQLSIPHELAFKELGFEDFKNTQTENDKIIEVAKSYDTLLQLYCDDSDLNIYGGYGCFYFMINKEDLKNLNFDNVKMTFQL